MTNPRLKPCDHLRFVIVLGAVCLLGGTPALSDPLYVEYQGDTLPAQDPNAPWAELGQGGILSVSQGILTAIDPDASAWVYMHRFEASLSDCAIVNIEARVTVPTGNGATGSPQLSLYDYDENLPPWSIAHVWYGLDLFPDAIEFAKWDYDAGGVRTLFARIPVPDLSSEFHLVQMTRVESSVRTFQIYLDGILVATVSGEPTDRPLDAVGFGYGMAIGVGESHWDFVRYWSEEPVAVAQTTWGGLKASLRQ
jgi:hypothetical protein